MLKNIDRSSILLFLACLAVGSLAARGAFTSAMNFPLIFGLGCLVSGLVSIARERPRVALFRRTALVVVGAGIAVGGWVLQTRLVGERLAQAQHEVAALMVGQPAPLLTALEPLNGAPATLEEAAGYSAKATIVTFWARWCSPCEKEMPELEALHRAHHEQGLRIVAVTRYDHPDDAGKRQRDIAKAKTFLAKRGLTFPAAITSADAIYRGFRVRSIPSSALVDEQGIIVAYGVGLEGARALMRKAVEMVVH